MKKTLLLITFLSISFGTYAQGEANIWYFGYNAGLDFNSGVPVALTDGKLQTIEGCATISNSLGQLLFYTDGITVWNKNHQVMSNGTGLMGHSSSTQSAIIVPKPGNPSIYYLFTVTNTGNPDGLRYSEVDMSLNAGLGNVTSNKNILLFTPTCEKLTAVKSSNGDAFWVVSHAFGDNRFLAYNVTAAGVNLAPIISNTGTAIIATSELNDETIGYLKFSPDGTKLISCNFISNVELFDFDAATGFINNPKTVKLKEENYGVEFSPSGKIAYVSVSKYGSSYLYQYDLTANDILSSQRMLMTKDSNQLAALQIAVDGKIYIAGWKKFSVINNPDVFGTGCNVQFDAISLGTGNSPASPSIRYQRASASFKLVPTINSR
jgi:WD40 repeat protein